MIKLPWSSPNDQQRAEEQLLQELLLVPPPTQPATLRPVVLCSVEEQRRRALRFFQLRTWVDHLLYRTERILTLTLVIFFGSWFVHTYGYDWFFSPASTSPQQATIAHDPTHVYAHPSQDSATPLPQAISSSPPASLPIETSDRAAPADYLDPQTIIAPPPASHDPRPHRLILPSLAQEVPVTEVFLEQGVWQVAAYAAGYHHGSALPGESSNTVLAGHAGLHGAVFRDLGLLQIDDELLLEAGGWVYRYQVRTILNVWPQQIEVMDPTPTPVLTLITCTAWDTQRLVVIADLIDAHPL